MPLDTLSNVKTQLMIGESIHDTLLEALQAAADSFIETYCDRSFLGGSFSEDHPGGSKLIFLKNYPVESIISVNVDANRTFTGATVLNASRYTLHPDRGVIESLHGPFLGDRASANSFPNAVRVSYSTASDAVPDAIKRAYAELIGHWFRQVKTDDANAQVNVLQRTDGTEVTQYPWQQSGGYKIPPSVKAVLDLYRG